MRHIICIAALMAALGCDSKRAQTSTTAPPKRSAVTLNAIACQRIPPINRIVDHHPENSETPYSQKVYGMKVGENAWVASVYQYHEHLYINPSYKAFPARHKGEPDSKEIGDYENSYTHIRRVEDGILVDCDNIGDLTNWDAYSTFDVSPYLEFSVVGSFTEKKARALANQVGSSDPTRQSLQAGAQE